MTEIIANPVGVFDDYNIEPFFRGAAKNTFYLKKVGTISTHVIHNMMCNPFPQVGVTHVLNTAEGQQSGTVDTNEKFYK